MPVSASDRPLEKVKEEVIDQLILNYSHGEISADAFERRLDQAYACNDQVALMALVADLPLQTDPRYHTEKASRMQPKFTASSNSDAPLTIRSILSSDQRSGEWIVPKEITINNYFGSTELDFRNAIFTHPDVIINVNSVMGSDEFIVSENIDVITCTTNIMGSVSNNKPNLAATNLTTQRPRLHIQGKVILGSIDIRIKQSIKQQVTQFANGLKDLFNDERNNRKSH
ncbi:LiaF domain-containing protein [Pseudoalteromonas sp. MMG012]|uniref:DUF1707 SHOCT-like domain-containing protein n=1 Tax=Pseudoalteromonas sp. MMG012 TaxID=2822686 RepID=UPI001B3A6D18|nr:LiaF domain-containing protein [Pseudoalteromonas sp. MMG012]MBQ4850594.1 DUF1707 and DUF2154 domain-containing protein [Pseudoalteromonas sp. MMG012]